MQLKFGVFCVQSSKQVLVPLDIKIRMQAALHQHAGAAESDGFVDSFTDLFYRMNVCIRFSGPAIKRAKGADDIADVGIIDVAVDDVGDDITRIFSLAYLIRGQPDANKIVGCE